MANFTAGTSFSDGVTNDVTAAKLNALVADAVPTSNLSLNSTTGTIATFNSTTPTFLGAITASTNTINIGSGQIYKDASGNVGINNSSPTNKLHVIGTTVQEGTLFIGDGSESSIRKLTNSTPLYFKAASGTQEMTIDSSGNVGIGSSNPSSLLHLASPNAIIRLQDTDTVGNGTNAISTWLTFRDSANTQTGYFGFPSDPNFTIWNQTNSSMIFGTNNQERIRITSGGYLKASNTGTYVNSAATFHEIRNDSSGNEALVLSNSATTAPYGMQIRFTSAPNDATSQFLNCNDGNGTTSRTIIRSNGGIQNYQANDGNLSDERLKTDIQPSPSYLDKICSIPVVNFKYKDQTHDDYNLGVIAQQVESVCPEFVDADGVGETPADGIPIKTIYQTDLQYALMKCIQELKSENDSLKSRIESLEAK